MNSLARLNSLGAGFRTAPEPTKRAPEAIILESLTQANEHPSIVSQIYAILENHGLFFDFELLEKYIRKNMRQGEFPKKIAALFAASILAKMERLSDFTESIIKENTLLITGEELFGNYYLDFEKIVSTLSPKDPDFLRWGFTVPLIKSAPKKSIVLDPLQFRHLNMHLSKRICSHCGGRTKNKRIDTDIKKGIRARRDRYFLSCEDCGISAPSEQARIKRLTIKKTHQEFLDDIGDIRKSHSAKNKDVAILLGITPQYLSAIKKGGKTPSKTLVKLTALLSKRAPR